ncbi:MAG: apolipoprotein A1/A4/E family protein [Alphaproteobacteria bacterium]|nr:apolipoprotein A1/A4/E family protein [Alphaproteobacteria bacterium]
MFTMTSLAITALWGIGNNGLNPTTLAQTLIQSTVALTTTITGLIARHIFLAFLPEPNTAMEECCDKIVQALGVGPDEVVKASQAAAAAIQKTTGQMAVNFEAVTTSALELNTQFGTLKASVGNLETSVNQSAANTVKRLSEATGDLDRTMESAKIKITKFESEIGDTLAGKLTEALDVKLSDFSALVTRFEKEINDLPNQIGKHLTATDRGLAEYVAGLKDQVAAFVLQEKSKVLTPITELAKELKKKMKEFSDTSERSQTEFSEQIKAITDICRNRAEAVFASNEKQINASTDSLRGILTALDADMRTRINEAILALKSVSDTYAGAVAENASSKNEELRKLKDAAAEIDDKVKGLYEVYSLLYDKSTPEKRPPPHSRGDKT